MKRLLTITLAILLSFGTAAAYEDFTDGWVELDPGTEITVAQSQVSWTGLNARLETGYVYKDYTLNHFNGDLNHQFEIQFNNIADGVRTYHWVLANSIKDVYAIDTNNEDWHCFFSYDDDERIYLQAGENGTPVSDFWADPGPQPATTYFITVDRDDDGGANSTGQLVAYIRTGSHTGTLKDTLTVDCSAGEQNDFQYLYACSTFDTDTDLGTIDGFTQNLDLNEVTIPIYMYHYMHH